MIVTLAGRSAPETLAAKRQVLKTELRRIDEEVQNEKEALARIEARIRLLENAGRQAA